MEHIRNKPSLPAMVEHKLRVLSKNLGDLTYDECIALGQDAEKILKDMNPFDSAIEYFIRQYINAYQYAELLNWHHGLERDEHAEPLQVLYALSKDNEVYEGCVYLPRYYHVGNRLNGPAGHHMRQMVIDHHNWRDANLRQFDLTVQ